MPFGIDDILLASLIGGGLGIAKTGKIKDGLLGAGLGAAGGYLLGPAMGAGAANGAAYTGTAAELAADGLGGVAMQPSMMESGLLGLKDFGKQAKPFMDAAGTGMQVAKELSPQETPPPQVTSQLPPRQPIEFPFSQMPLQAITDDNERRKRMMQQYVQNMRY